MFKYFGFALAVAAGISCSEVGTIPEPVLEMFDIHPGEKIMLLADKRQGMALVKCSQFD